MIGNVYQTGFARSRDDIANREMLLRERQQQAMESMLPLDQRAKLANIRGQELQNQYAPQDQQIKLAQLNLAMQNYGLRQREAAIQDRLAQASMLKDDAAYKAAIAELEEVTRYRTALDEAGAKINAFGTSFPASAIPSKDLPHYLPQQDGDAGSLAKAVEVYTSLGYPPDVSLDLARSSKKPSDEEIRLKLMETSGYTIANSKGEKEANKYLDEGLKRIKRGLTDTRPEPNPRRVKTPNGEIDLSTAREVTTKKGTKLLVASDGSLWTKDYKRVTINGIPQSINGSSEWQEPTRQILVNLIVR